MPTIRVNFQNQTGRRIRPLHGVNSGPLTKVFTYDARPLFREGGFPFARLHDVEYPYGSGEFVDIPCIFRDFHADETREENYNFGLTDEYLKACVEVGCEPLFRLGVSIEHAPVKRHVFPPQDFGKWARICEHIIRHYTQGWANGFHWNIRYWEIWNEADSAASGADNMWCGTPEEFYEFYCVSATYLKQKFPHLKIGGCGYTSGVNPFIEDFFRYLTAKPYRVPLDFYSWHSYTTDVSTVVDMSRRVACMLESFGYGDAESVFDEWNYMRDWKDQAESYVLLKNHVGAAFCGAMLCAMQNHTNIAEANYFEADVVKEWCGIFTVDRMSIGARKAVLAPLKPFYAFRAFHALYQMGREVAVEGEEPGLYATAAVGEGKAGLLIANYGKGKTSAKLLLSGLPGPVEVRVVDAERTFERVMTLSPTAGELCATMELGENTLLYLGSA